MMQKKNYLKKMRFFLRWLFYDTPAVIVIFVAMMVITAGYMIYSKEKNNDSAKTATEFQTNQVQPEETDDMSDTDIAEPENKMKTVILKSDWTSGSADEEKSFSEEELILQFEDMAVIKTPAVRVEVKRPGQVVFAINRSDLDQMPEIMEQLADLYMDTVSRSKPVTVHFMVGGGARGVHTFLPK